MASSIDYGNGIIAIDANYTRPGLAAIHLLRGGDEAALVDTGVNSSVPAILASLAEQGIAPQQVSWIILTHIHLDHAGAAGLLARHLPNARVLVHPRGVRHLAEPGKLIAGTEAVYGAARARQLYGDILPVAAERIVAAEHGSQLALGERSLTLLHTPGHALHHICIVDDVTGHIFSGDTFGICYRELDRAGSNFMFATTTPVHFDPQALYQSIDLLCSYQPAAIYLTHYSQVREIPARAAALKACIQAHVDIALAARDAGHDRVAAIRAALGEYVRQASRQQGWQLQGAEAVAFLRGDIELNSLGLDVWLSRRDGPPA